MESFIFPINTCRRKTHSAIYTKIVGEVENKEQAVELATSRSYEPKYTKEKIDKLFKEVGE